jgi:hypothetical protein
MLLLLLLLICKGCWGRERLLCFLLLLRLLLTCKGCWGRERLLYFLLLLLLLSCKGCWGRERLLCFLLLLLLLFIVLLLLLICSCCIPCKHKEAQSAMDVEVGMSHPQLAGVSCSATLQHRAYTHCAAVAAPVLLQPWLPAG